MYNLFKRCSFLKRLHVSASSPRHHQVISLKWKKLYNVWQKTVPAVSKTGISYAILPV